METLKRTFLFFVQGVKLILTGKFKEAWEHAKRNPMGGK